MKGGLSTLSSEYLGTSIESSSSWYNFTLEQQSVKKQYILKNVIPSIQKEYGEHR